MGSLSVSGGSRPRSVMVAFTSWFPALVLPATMPLVAARVLFVALAGRSGYPAARALFPIRGRRTRLRNSLLFCATPPLAVQDGTDRPQLTAPDVGRIGFVALLLALFGLRQVAQSCL